MNIDLCVYIYICVTVNMCTPMDLRIPTLNSPVFFHGGHFWVSRLRAEKQMNEATVTAHFQAFDGEDINVGARKNHWTLQS